MPTPQAVDQLAQILAAEGYDPAAQEYLANRAMQERIGTQTALRMQRDRGGYDASKRQLMSEAEALSPALQMQPVDPAAGEDPGFVGGFGAGFVGRVARSKRGVSQALADAMPGTFAINPEVEAQYAGALGQFDANQQAAGASGTIGNLAGSMLPYLAGAPAGPAVGAAVLGGLVGSQSYGDARAELGLDPADAAVRAVLQGGLAAASAPIAPLTSRLAPTGSLVRDAVRGVGAGAAEAIPQSIVADYGGALVDIGQGRARGDVGQEEFGRSMLEQLPEHMPEMMLANAVAGGGFHTQAMRAQDNAAVQAIAQRQQAEMAKRQLAAQTGMRDPRDPAQAGARLGIPGEQLAPGEAPRAVAADRAAKIQADLENAQAIQMHVADAQSEQARQAEGEAMALRMGQRADRDDVRSQMGLGDLAAGLTEPAPIAGDNPVGGLLQQREAATAASARGVRARQEAEIARLEQEAERLNAESAALESEVEGRNAAENVDYLRAEIARLESTAAQAGVLGRAEEYRTSIRERDRLRKQLASAEPTAQEHRQRLDAAKRRLEANQRRQEGIRSRMAPEPVPVAEAPAAAPVAPVAAPAPAAPAPVKPSAPIAAAPAKVLPPPAPALAPAGPPATSPPKHTVVTTADGATGASLSAAMGVMRRTGNAMWNYLGGKKAIIAAKGYDGIIAAGKQVRRVVDAFGGSGLPTQMARRIVPGAGRAINDLNPEVVNLHTQVRDNPDAVVAEGHRLFDDFTREVLEPGYDIDAQQFAGLTFADNFSRRAPGSEAERAALMSLRFSKLTGGALGKGEPTAEDIPGGIKWAELAAARGTSREKIDRLKREFEANIRGHSQSLQGTEITQRDARQILTDAQQGDVVFVDPPYYSKDEGGDVLDYGAEYGADLTTVEGNLAFVRESVFPAAQRGVQTIYSNYWNDAVAQAFTDAGFKVRKVARQGQHGKVVHEIIAWNPDGAAIKAEPAGAPAGAGAAPPGGAGPAASGPSPAPAVVPAAGSGPAPAGAAPVRPGGADGGPRPSARLGGKLSDALHNLAVTDAAGVRGVAVGRDADGHTTITLDIGGGEKLTGRLVADERTDVEANKDAWMASALSRNRPEVVARALRDAIIEAHPTALVPSWLTSPKPPSIEKLVGNWKIIQQKFPQAVLKLMEKSPRLAVLLPNGKAFGADFAIGLTKHYQGRELREETWHLGWHTLTEAEKGLLLKRLPPAQRASVLSADGRVLRPQHALELGTDLLMKLYDRHLREGRKPVGWFGSLLARIRAKMEKLLPFLAPKVDAGMELAREFGEGRIFERMRKVAPPAEGEAMAVASLRDTRRKVAAESDEGRTTVAAMNERAERILRDETLWSETLEAAKDDPAKLSQDQVRALNRAAADTMRAALTGGEAKQAKLLDDYDMIAALRMRANRVSAQDLRALQEDDRNLLPIDRVLTPMRKPSGYWKRQLDKASTPDKAAEVMRAWRERNDRVLDALKRRGIDLRDEATRRAVDDAEADAIAAMEYTIDAEVRAQRSWEERWQDLTAARVVSDLTMRTLLWPGSATLQGVSTANFVGRSGVRAGMEHLLRGIDGLDADVLAGFGGRREALGHMLASVTTGMRLGLESVYTGDSVAKPKLAGREAGEEIMAGQEFRSPLQDLAEQIKAPWLGALTRTGLGPGLEAIRFVDETVWAATFDATRRMLGAKRAQESGRSVEEAMTDQDIADAAVAHADRVTQRTRPEDGTPFGAVFKGLELLRSPSLGGRLTHAKIGNWSKFPLAYNWLFHIMPIFRSVALLTAEAGKYAAAPVRGVQAAATLRKLKSPERIAEMAAERGVGESEIRRELTNDLLEQMTDTLVGMLGYAVAAAVGEDDLPAPRGGEESAQEERTRDLAKPQGTFAGMNIQRMSPVYEALQAGAAVRDVAKGRQSVNEAITGLGRAILEKPLLGGVKSLFRPQTDPRTGEPMSMSEYAWSQLKRQTLSPGAPWSATARAFTETEQTRPGDPDNAGIGQERVPVTGLTGEGRTVETGLIGRGIFGLSPRAKASEQRVAAMIVRLNEAAEAEARKGLAPGQRLHGVGWWPGAVKKDLPVEGNRQAVERMSPAQLARMERLTGEAFWKALQPRLEEIERVGAKSPQAALKALQRLRSGAAKQAFAAVWREREAG